MRDRVIRVEEGRRLPVSVPDGFDYITDPRNWLAYWPRAVSVDPGTRWQRPGDRARITLRLAGRRVSLEMRLVRFDPYRLVEYTSEQAGLPAAVHRRHFEARDGELAYRIVIEYEPRPGWRGILDRTVVRRATERAVRDTIANLDERFRSLAGDDEYVRKLRDAFGMARRRRDLGRSDDDQDRQDPGNDHDRRDAHRQDGEVLDQVGE